MQASTVTTANNRKSKPEFSSFAAVLVLVNLIVSKLLLSYPKLVVQHGATGAVLLAILTVLASALLFLITQLLYRKFNGKGILEIAEKYLGDAARKAVASVLCVAYFAFLAYNFAVTVETFKAISLPRSPYWFIGLFFAVAICAGAYAGLTVVVRLHVIIVPVTVAAMLSVFALTAPSFDFGNLFPFLGAGAGMLTSGFSLTSIFFEMGFLFLLMPYVDKNASSGKIGWTALLVSGALFILAVAAFLLCVPYPTANTSYMPIYQLEKFIRFGNITVSVAPWYTLVWSMSLFLQMSLFLITVCRLGAEAFGKRDINRLILPVALAVYLLCAIPPISSYILSKSNAFNFMWIAGFLLPALVFLMARIAGRRKRQ